MNLKCVVFDFDGTLVDSMPVWEKLPERYLKKKGIAPEAHVFDAVRNFTIAQSAQYFKEKYNLPEDSALIALELKETLFETYVDETVLKPGAENLLKNLSSRGVKMAVATAAEFDLVSAALARLGVKGFFGGIMTATMAGKPKTSPDIYFKAIQMLGCTPEESVVVEDALYAINTAVAAGLKVVAVYDELSAQQQDIIKQTASIYYKSLSDWNI